MNTKQILQKSLAALKKSRKVWMKGADGGYINGFKKAKLLYNGAELFPDGTPVEGVRTLRAAKAKADCFCARGLVRHIGKSDRSAANKALQVLAAEVPQEFADSTLYTGETLVVEYNDHSTRRYPQIIKWFERAVKAA